MSHVMVVAPPKVPSVCLGRQACQLGRVPPSLPIYGEAEFAEGFALPSLRPARGKVQYLLPHMPQSCHE